jgi:phosphopantothenate-cysteine ligase
MKEKLIPILKDQQKTKNYLLKITFTTLSEYLHVLREVASILQKIGINAMLYLAAAVSDFYIPSANMVFQFNINSIFHKLKGEIKEFEISNVKTFQIFNT